MAYPIGLVFAGLMVLCLDGKDDCTVDGYHTAWIVKANGGTEACGRLNGEKTQFKLSFNSKEFASTERVDFLNCTREGDITTCELNSEKLCVATDASPSPKIKNYPGYLLSLHSLSSKFKGWNKELLEKESSIQVLRGELSYKRRIPKDDKDRYYWYGSYDNGTKQLTKFIADQVEFGYTANIVKFTSCIDGSKNFFLIPQQPDAEINFFNYAQQPPTPDTGQYNDVKYDDLAYLLWYNRLGVWDTGICPDYAKEPMLLRCKWIDNKSCAKWGDNEAGSTMWPPIVKGE